MTHLNHRHSGAQNFDDELSVTHSKRSGVLTDASSSQTDDPHTEEIRIPEADEQTAGKKKHKTKKMNKRDSKAL